MSSIHNIMHRLPFTGRILFLGFGGVARCTLPLILRHIDVPADRITVMDMTDHRDQLPNLLAQGMKYHQERLVKERYKEQLSELVGPGDMIIDLAWNISCTDMLDWCHKNNVLYINTSVELWDPFEDKENKHPTERTLYVRHMEIRKLVRSWKESGPTAILEHGANPGLVSHFTKKALVDIAEKVIREKRKDPRRHALEHAISHEHFAALAHLLDIQAIHISEIDTQATKLQHDPKIFRNTWSVEGLYEEGIAPSEMGWGSHERTMPADAHQHKSGPQNAICLQSMGIDTFVKTRVPSRELIGMAIRHGEAFTLSDYLTVWSARGEAMYRPTVHYAYCPCPSALEALTDLRANKYEMLGGWKIMGDEITTGIDELGVLLMGHDFKSWWTGTILSIEEARSLVPNQNATTLQVAASILAAVCWMIKHPQEGVKIPDQLPYREILDLAKPYLGHTPSMALDWTPTGVEPDDNTWQFSNFRLEGTPQELAKKQKEMALKKI